MYSSYSTLFAEFRMGGSTPARPVDAQDDGCLAGGTVDGEAIVTRGAAGERGGCGPGWRRLGALDQ